MAITPPTERVPYEPADVAVAPRPTPLIATKLHATRVAVYGDRPRVRALLDRALEDAARLTLLSAPPGYGKSVAVAGWLQAGGLPSAWLSLDAGDNDPVRFVRYLAAALSPLRPGIARVAETLEGAPGPETGAVLIDAIGASDDPFVLVLDDYHAIVSGAVHALVRDLVEHGPPFAHIVILTREDPPFPLPRLRAHRRLVEIRADDLRYTVDEAAAYLAQGPAGVELDQVHLGRLVERTEGWIAGLQLASITLRDQSTAAARTDAFAGTQRYVLDYLAAEVLGGLDPELRRFLIRSSVAERFTADLCRDLTGCDDSVGMLARAEQMNLFLIPLDLERRWYRFHHLFADYLRTLLDRAETVALRERAADHLEAAGLLEEAIGQAVEAGSTDRAICLLERQARRTYQAGELSTLLGWLDRLPSDRIVASPELTYLRAIACFYVGRVDDAARTCDAGEAACTDGIPGSLMTACALIAAFSNRSDAVDLASTAVATVEDDAFVRARALQALATAHLAAGHLEEAAETARRALAVEAVPDRGAGQRSSTLDAPAVTALVTVLNLTGRRGDAEALCRQALADHGLEVRTMAGGTPYALYWLGSIRYEAGDLAEAREALERGWAATGTFGFGRALLSSAVLSLALVRHATGSHEAALDAVRTVRRDARRAGLRGIDETLDEIEARIHLLGGDTAAAGRWADRTDGCGAGSCGSGFAGLARDITLARARVAQGDSARARRLLEAARAVAASAHDTADLIAIGMLDAAAAEASGQRSAALRALEAAIALAAPEGYLRRVVDDGRAVVHLLPAVRRIAPAFVDRVSAALAASDSPTPATRRTGPSLWQDEDGSLVETLTARELEVLRLMASGASDAAIARELVVSLATAKWHAAHVRAKLGAKTRTQALLRAQELRLV